MRLKFYEVDSEYINYLKMIKKGLLRYFSKILR